MSDLPETLSSEILIVGAGVLGLCTAVELTRRGHRVRVIDAGGANASSVAAGMIAPAMESVLDRVTPERALLMRDARVLWDGFAEASGIAIHPARTVWAGRKTGATSKALEHYGYGPGEVSADGHLVVPIDALVEPGPALATMRAALVSPVVVAQVQSVSRTQTGWRLSTDHGPLEATTLVLATGAAQAFAGLPASTAELLDQITPVRGQIGLARTPTEAVVRGLGVYVAPSGAGGLIGATMDPGRRDLEPDEAAGEQLTAAAAELLGQAVDGAVDWRVGIRGATPDGLPMAGPSDEAGLYLALAPRRNGWLLGPLVAQVVADEIEGGGARLPHAAALDPRRFAIR